MIDKYIPKIDKLKHFYLWTLFFLFASIVLVCFIDNTIAMCISYGLTVLTAAGKEYRDTKNPKRHSEWLDFWFSIFAPSLIIILVIILNR